ncbi:hypothetical protein NPS53_08895 [Pseudomonas putida]|uniref:hypothetical protein n=1 Tax=Pseudomonas putida TaxID=303 RepID=UPI0023635A10|nr:hypothetical protein [Pseudomonas putida]MDD2139691.1 hypothetical protein [Pseudomonas putida]HDS1721615.1 hypothetical protein [Pseudomonas putida]
MTIQASAPTTRSEKLFDQAFILAMAGQHRDSDGLLELAHEMRAMELRVSQIAQHAPNDLALLLVKEAMTGFTDEVDPAQYVRANLEPIRFYAANDAQLRGLIEATLNPQPYERDQISLSADELAAAQVELDRRRGLDPAMVTDPIITTGTIGIQARGFTLFTNGGRCSILRECPSCRGKYSTKAHAHRRIFWYCPHCNVAQEA